MGELVSEIFTSFQDYLNTEQELREVSNVIDRLIFCCTRGMGTHHLYTLLTGNSEHCEGHRTNWQRNSDNTSENSP
jgi:hypothetical protein